MIFKMTGRLLVSLFVMSTANAEGEMNPVVPSGIYGAFRHGTFPSLENRTHVGIDILSPCGQDVIAFADGRVVDLIGDSKDQNFNSLGYMVLIEHPPIFLEKSYYTLYLHLDSQPNVRLNDDVIGGISVIGGVGLTGAANGTCHTHFEIRYFRSRFFPSWLNIYGPGDKSASPEFLENWEDPERLFSLFPNGARFTRVLGQIVGQDEIYWLQNRNAYHVLNLETLAAMSGLRGWKGVNKYQSDLLVITDSLDASAPGQFQEGAKFIDASDLSNGLLIKTLNNPAVYLMEGGKKHHITESAFIQRELDWNDIIDVSQVILDSIPTGSPITTQPTGKIVGQVVKVMPGEPNEFVKRPDLECEGFSLPEVFISWTGPESGSTSIGQCATAPFYDTGPLPTGFYTLTISLPDGWQTLTESVSRFVSESGRVDASFRISRAGPAPPPDRPRFEVSKSDFCLGNERTLAITNGAPNSAVFLSAWKNGSLFVANLNLGSTDNAGTWGPQTSVLQGESLIGSWQGRVRIAGKNSNFVSFNIADCAQAAPPVIAVGSASYCVGETSEIRVRGKPNSSVDLHGISNSIPWVSHGWGQTTAEGLYHFEGQIAANAVGSYTLWVVIDGRESNTADFTVSACSVPAPKISSIAPDPVPPDEQTVLEVGGEGFQPGFRAEVLVGTESFGIISAGLEFRSSRMVRVSVKMTGRPQAYTATLKILNPDGQSAFQSFGVASTSPPVTLSMSPSSGPQGTTFNFSGSGYTPNGAVNRFLRNPDGSQQQLANRTANSSGQVSWSFTSTCDNAPGTYTIWAVDAATNRRSPDVGQTITANSACDSSPDQPTISNLSPSTVTSQVITELTVTGNGFEQSFTAAVIVGSQTHDLHPSALGWDGSHQVRVRVAMGDPPAGQSSYTATLRITNPDGQSASRSFTVNRQEGPSPSAPTASPPSGNWTSSPQNVQVSSLNSERIWYTIRSTIDGSTPPNPPTPTPSLNDGSIIGSSGTFPVVADEGQFKRLKVRFRGENNAGLGPSSPIHAYSINLRPQAGSVEVRATLNSTNWEGALSVNITGPNGTVGRSSVPTTLPDVPAGTYSVEFRGQGPENATFDGYSPAQSQVLNAGESISFNLNFSSIPLGAFSLTATPQCDGNTSEIRLQWTESTGAAAYRVYRDGIPRAVGSALSYTHTDLSPGVEHSYFVRANDNYGQTKDSNHLTVQAPYCSPFNFDLFRPVDDTPWHTGKPLTYPSTIYGGVPPFAYVWGGEASGSGTWDVTTFNSPGPETTLTYTTPGTKTVTLTMTDANNRTEVRSATIDVFDPPPNAVTIHVVGRLDGSPWSGAADYMITGSETGHVINGSYIDPEPDGSVFTEAPPDQYTITYLGSGPADGVFLNPDRMTLSAGDIGWFYLEFQTLLPDLQDYNFGDAGGGWDGPLIVSTEPGNHTLTRTVPVNQELFVDFALRNYPFNTTAVPSEFEVELYVDGDVVGSWTVAPLDPGDVFTVEDYIISFSTTGTHRVEFKIDPQNRIPEKRENNNGWHEDINAVP